MNEFLTPLIYSLNELDYTTGIPLNTKISLSTQRSTQAEKHIRAPCDKDNPKSEIYLVVGNLNLGQSSCLPHQVRRYINLVRRKARIYQVGKFTHASQRRRTHDTHDIGKQTKSGSLGDFSAPRPSERPIYRSTCPFSNYRLCITAVYVVLAGYLTSHFAYRALALPQSGSQYVECSLLKECSGVRQYCSQTELSVRCPATPGKQLPS